MIAVLIPDEDGTSAGEKRVVWDKNNDTVHWDSNTLRMLNSDQTLKERFCSGEMEHWIFKVICEFIL